MRRRTSYAIEGLCLLLMTAALSGCAIGRVGTLAAHVEQRDSVTVVGIYAVGLQVRTWDADQGANLGYSRRIYTLPADAAMRPGWHFFVVPEPSRDSLALDLMTMGFELSLSDPDAGLSLGYARKRLFARLPSDADVLLEFLGSDLRIGRFTICEKETPCVLP